MVEDMFKMHQLFVKLFVSFSCCSVMSSIVTDLHSVSVDSIKVRRTSADLNCIKIYVYFSYVQVLIQEQGQEKSPPSAPVGGAAAAVKNFAKMAGPVLPSQVDIMQMLSKAQQEYDTVSGKRNSAEEAVADMDRKDAVKTTSHLSWPYFGPRWLISHC